LVVDDDPLVHVLDPKLPVETPIGVDKEGLGNDSVNRDSENVDVLGKLAPKDRVDVTVEP